MANTKKKCKLCKEYTRVETGVQVPIGYFCHTGHALAFANMKQNKAKQKAAKNQHKADKERIKPKSKWLSELQALVNKYVRLRDCAQGCISCDKPSSWSGQWHASHYYSRGHSASLRFNLWNIHKGCSVCNSHLSGNIGEYTPGLIAKIGNDRYEFLVRNKSKPASYDVEWIKRAIIVFRKLIKREERKHRQH